ncbi:Ras-domain-containing protein [Mycena venus]|uniref:Ras-domain-containing protein n=1 Tax=Mycena venus TaxID=2733690 RepID=A0A8H7CKS2_9AGAR|nr:Ras-domain-containing protein [Mycena venus]
MKVVWDPGVFNERAGWPRTLFVSENVFEDARVSGSTRAQFRFLFLACWLATQPITHSGPEETVVKLKCWDTAGPESFRSVTRSCYRGAAEGGSSCPTSDSLLVYDVTSRRSFDNLRTWLADVCAHTDAHASCILMGNKRDLCEGEAWTASLVYRVVAREPRECATLERVFHSPFPHLLTLNLAPDRWKWRSSLRRRRYALFHVIILASLFPPCTLPGSGRFVSFPIARLGPPRALSSAFSSARISIASTSPPLVPHSLLPRSLPRPSACPLRTSFLPSLPRPIPFPFYVPISPLLTSSPFLPSLPPLLPLPPLPFLPPPPPPSPPSPLLPLPPLPSSPSSPPSPPFLPSSPPSPPFLPLLPSLLLPPPPSSPPSPPFLPSSPSLSSLPPLLPFLPPPSSPLLPSSSPFLPSSLSPLPRLPPIPPV